MGEKYRNLAHEFVTKRKTYQGDPDDTEARDEFLEVSKRWDGEEGYYFAVQHFAELRSDCPQWIQNRALRVPRFTPVPTGTPIPAKWKVGDRVTDGGVLGTIVECFTCDGDGWIENETDKCPECHGSGTLHQPDVRPEPARPSAAPVDQLEDWKSNSAIVLPNPDPQRDFFQALMDGRVYLEKDPQYGMTRIRVDPGS